MALTWSSTPVEGVPLLTTKYRTTNMLTAYDYGPVAKQDVSDGLYDNVWKAWVDESDDVRIQNITTGSAATLEFNQAGILNIDLTFDQLGRPVIAFDTGSTIYLYWFDPVGEIQTITSFGSGKRVCCSLDERRFYLLDRGNIIFAYQRGNTAYYRLQEDRYLVEYSTPLIDVVDLNVCGLTFTNQLRIQLAYQPIS